MKTEFRYRDFINIHGHNFFMDLRKFTVLRTVNLWTMILDDLNTICYLKLQLNEKLIPWFN